MSQHDMNLINAAGAAVRSDINDALAALVSNNSGATEPATTFAYMPWADSTSGIFKIRNAANTGWISLFTIATGKMFLAAQVAVSDAAADTTTWVLLAGAQTGDQEPKTDASLTYNASTNVLTVNISGNATSATTASTCSDEIGVGQTWANVTTSRAFSTRYTNSTARPIQVKVSASLATGQSIQLKTINETEIIDEFYNANAAVVYAPVSAIIPAGQNYYVLPNGGATLRIWHELR